MFKGSTANGSKLPMTTAERLLQAELPPRPAVLTALTEEMQNEEPDLAKVSTLVSADVGLASSVIKTVNSPYFGLSRQVASVQQAITFLGLAEVFGIVTGALLRRTFVCLDPLMETLWDTSSARGVLMRRLARELHVLAPDRAYTCGLFENAGMALLLMHAPGYSHTVAQASDELALMDRERVRYGVDHATLGQALMRTWGLPEELALAVRLHHGLVHLQGDETPILARQLIALSALANAVLSRNSRDWEQLRELVASILELPLAQLQAEFDACAAETSAS
jgi:HD-like signal output (HDOD) protein